MLFVEHGHGCAKVHYLPCRVSEYYVRCLFLEWSKFDRIVPLDIMADSDY